MEQHRCPHPGILILLVLAACASGPMAWDVLSPTGWPATTMPPGGHTAIISPSGGIRVFIFEHQTGDTASRFLESWSARFRNPRVISPVTDRGIQLARRFRAASVATLHLGLADDKGRPLSSKAFAYQKGATLVLIEIRTTGGSPAEQADGLRVAESFRFR